MTGNGEHTNIYGDDWGLFVIVIATLNLQTSKNEDIIGIYRFIT